MSWSSWPTTGVAPPTVVQGPVINSAPNVANPAAATSMVAQSQYTPEQWAQMQQHNWQQWAQWQQQFQQWQQQYGAEYQKTMSAMTHVRGGAPQSNVPYYNMTAPAQPPLPIETKPPPPPDDSHGGQTQQTQPNQQQAPQQQQQLQQQQLQQQLQQQQLQQQQLQQQQLQQHQLQQQPPLPQIPSATTPALAPSLYTATQYTQPPPMLPGSYTTAPPPPQSTPKDQYQYNQNQQPNAMQKNQTGFENRSVPDDNQKFGRNQNFPANKNNTNWQNQGNRNQGSRSDYGAKRPFNQGNERGDVKRNRLDNQPEGNKWQGSNQRPPQRWNESGSNQRNQRWGETPLDSEQYTQSIDGTNNNQRNNQRWGEPLNRMDNKQQLKSAQSGVKPNSDEPSEAEKKFDKQFGEWEAQFQKWKEQNANHPDKSQYQEYEKKWVTWRAQLLERREQMRRKRLGISGEGSKTSQDKPQSVIKSNEPQSTSTEHWDHSQPPPQFAQQHSYSDNRNVTHTPQIGPQVIPPLMGKSSSENSHDVTSVSEFQENKQCPISTAESNEVAAILESSHNENNQAIDTSGDLPPENVAGEISQVEENSTELVKPNSIDDIPGLDLPKIGAKPNALDESSITEEQKQKPDLEAISRGINSILGDQNLMNMLSLVSQAQPSQSTTTDTQNTVVPVESNSPKFSPEEYGGNIENEEFLSQDNIDDQSQNSFPVTNVSENFNRLNEEENASFNCPSFDIESDFKGQEITGNVDNIKGPQHTFNKGFNDFNKTNTYKRPEPFFNTTENIDRASNNDFNQESDCFNKSADNISHGRNVGQCLDNFNSSRGSDNYTSDGLNRGNVDNLNRNTDTFNRASDNFSQSGGSFNRTTDNFNRGLDNFSRGPENFNRGLGNFNRGPDNSNRGPGNFNRGPDNFNRGTDNFNRGPDNFNRNSEHFNPNPDNFSRSSGNFSRGTDHFNRGSDHVSREQDSFNRNADKFGGKPNNPPKNPPSLLDIDFSKGPVNFNKGPGNFGKGSDNNRGQEFDRSWESDNSRRSSDEFNREGPTAGAGNFKGIPGGFNKRGSSTFNRNGSESNRRGFDNFNRGGNDFTGGRLDVNRGAESNFQRGGPDTFSRGRADNLSRTGAENFTKVDTDNFDEDTDKFNRGGSDNFRGRDVLNRGPPPNDFQQDRFNRGADLFPQEPDNSYQEPENFNMLANDFDRGPEKFNIDNRLGKRLPDAFEAHGNVGRDSNRIEPLLQFEPPSPRIKPNVPSIEAVVSRVQEEKDDGIWKPSTVIDYEHKSLKPTEPDVLLIPINTFDYRHKLLSRIPYPQRPKWLSDIMKNIPQFDSPIGRQFDSRKLFDDRDRKLFDEKDRKAFDVRDRKLLEDRDRKSFDDRNRKFFDDHDRDRATFEDRDRKFFDDRDRKSFDDRDRKSFDDRDRKSFDDRDRKSFDDRDRKSFDDRDRKSFDDRDKKAFDNWDRKSSDDRDRKPFEGRDKKSFEDRDRKSLDDRERKFMDDRDRTFFDERGRKYSEDRDRKSNNEERKDRKLDDRDRRSSDDRDRRRSDEHDYKTYGNHDQKDKDEFKDDDNLEAQNFDVKKTKDNQFEESEKAFNFDGSEQKNTMDANEPNYKQRTGKTNVTLVEDLLCSPGRFNRPPRIVIILRGPPGSGKSYLAKLIKDKEVENGGSAPRIICLDDYFMVDQEKEIEEDGEKVKVREMVYEYEECMEATYRQSLMKSFKKTITDGYFSFIIVDNINDKVKYFGEMWSFAKQNGFQVYICEMGLDVQACTKRNIHGRSEIEIERCVAGWEPTPSHHPIVDASSLLQIGDITEVEMEEATSPSSIEANVEEHISSKWDSFDYSVDNLAKLDGISKPLRPSKTMEDYLQLDEWTEPVPTKPGQKRVRWADLEEHKKQEKMRAIGFVVGHTNWDRMMDPTKGSSALTQTKYIERYK